MSKLQEIEKEISSCLSVDKSNWIRIYRLIDEVDRDKLYLERTDTPSFTSWVNYLAGVLNVHVSLLWSRKKAGKVYDEYRQRAIEQNRTVPELEDLRISPDSISLCERVAGKNAKEMDRLIEKVIDGTLTREDLRAAAKAKRAGNGIMATTRHDRIEPEDRTETEDIVTAADIMMALRKSGWLKIQRDEPYFDHVYHCYAEFRVDTGTSHHARRIDALIAETLTESERDRITLRGVEIKVDCNDLKNDHKMAEYCEFVDYFYLAIPEDSADMLELAKSVIRPEWGIITVSKDGIIKIKHDPERLNPTFRDKTMSTALIKMLSERS